MRSTLLKPLPLVPFALAILLLTACDDAVDPMAGGVEPEPEMSVVTPAGLTEVTMGTSTIRLWPYTGTDVSGAQSDPINLLFPGRGLRDVRAALIALDGNRSAFGLPPVAPFDCRWSDAVGANQTSFTAEAGWQGSAIQLECGDYAPMRFHVRLFEAAGGTVGNAHFEVIIPGTNQHEVLSWELAEQVLTVDMIRSGLLAAPPAASEPINPAPTYKTINPLIYNGLPVALRGLIGGPLGNVAAPVPIPSNGRASVFALRDVPAAPVMDATEHTVLNFGQVIPKPFCASPADFVYVTGPIDFVQRVVVGVDGDYAATFEARGELTVTPIDPVTRQPVGAPYTAQVKALYTNHASDGGSRATNYDRQVLRRGDLPDQRLVSRLVAGLGAESAHTSVQCE